ncbi:MAG: recombination mediator RecR [Proteobacteria bacterium]|nr:recombination mediator RecR [Pseudomonadota bacterium]
MSLYPPTLVRLIRELSRLPGIGEKTAERLAMHLLRSPRVQAENLADSIRDARTAMRLCSLCFGLADAELCPVCAKPDRNTGVACVVEQPSDLVALERSGAVSGRYHVLGGILSPMNGVGPTDLRLRELFARVDSGEVSEVLVAVSPSVEGEATAAFIREKLSGRARVTRIATGIPVGGDLKYMDGLTLRRAIDNRQEL